jgi:hypothetical protein
MEPMEEVRRSDNRTFKAGLKTRIFKTGIKTTWFEAV